MAVKIPKDKLIKALTACGMADAANFPDKKLIDKANKLSKLMKEDQLSRIQPPAAQKFVRDMIAKLNSGETYELAGAAATAATASKSEAKEKKGGGGVGAKGVGVIAKICEMLEKASKTNPVTKAAILEALVKTFSDRPESAMKTTLGIQLPTRLNAKKYDGKITKTDKGYYIAK